MTVENSSAENSSEVKLSIPHSRPIITYILLAIIVGIFLFQVGFNQVNFPEREPLTAWGSLSLEKVLNGEYYRLLTSMFLHVNEIHIVFNGIALYIAGVFVETFFGRARFTVIYFLGGLCGGVASILLTRGAAVGASGAIFAIFGAELIFLYRNRLILGPAGQQALRNVVILAVVNFGFGIITNLAPNSQLVIDNWAHAGGFLGGMLLAWYIGPQFKVRADSSTTVGYRLDDEHSLEKTWQVPALLTAGLIAVIVLTVVTRR